VSDQAIIKLLLSIIGAMVMAIAFYYVNSQANLDQKQWEAIAKLRKYHMEKVQ